MTGTLVVLWQLWRRGRSEPIPSGAPVIAHHRAQLERQRAALASVFWWYLLPLLPGLALFLYAAAPTREPWIGAASATFCAVVFVGVWWLNHRAARALAGEVAELTALE